MAGRAIAKECTLTRAGQKLAEVLLDPRSEKMTAVQRAQAAGISLRRYHELMADPNFQAVLKARALEMLTPSLPSILKAAQETAATPGRDGFKDREMLLRMVSWYDPKAKATIEHAGSGGGPIEIVLVKPKELEESDDGVGGTD